MFINVALERQARRLVSRRKEVVVACPLEGLVRLYSVAHQQATANQN